VVVPAVLGGGEKITYWRAEIPPISFNLVSTCPFGMWIHQLRGKISKMPFFIANNINSIFAKFRLFLLNLK